VFGVSGTWGQPLGNESEHAVAVIGIRREDKSEWEGRVPLVPDDLARLVREQGLRFHVQSAANRAFTDDAFRAAGAAVAEDLRDCPLILGVKEIPPEKLEPDKTYVYFAHVIKGQPANMPALRRLVELNCTLIDYERIVDDQNRRLVFFGRFAGLAGMIDTLWAFGQRLQHEGIESPFSRVRPAHRYDDLDHVRREFADLAQAIRRDGLPTAIRPLICGFAGYGQVSQGAQQIYDLLPITELAPEQLAEADPDANTCYKVVFREEHLVDRIDASRPFELTEYYEHPDRYRAAFFQHAPHLAILVNCIYWEPKYPRLISREQFQELYAADQPRLRVVGDITCDIDGSLACTTRSTDPASPIYVYDPASGETQDGVAGNGPVVLAVDFLPCELPVDASRYFSQAFSPFVPALANADLSKPLSDSGLPPELQRATIVHNGRLTEPYRYLERELR
jgi:alpha-aminoadipic semialdehyde synthase